MNKQSEKLKVKGEKYKICATDFEGITLVALVITIIVLIILAAVSINAVMNDGLINNAKEAKKKYENATKNEDKAMQLLEYATAKYVDGTIAKELKLGEYVNYVYKNTDGEEITVKCRVLYNDDEYGFQIVPLLPVADLTLGSTDFDEALNICNNLEQILNNEAEKYVNKELALSGRVFSSNPNGTMSNLTNKKGYCTIEDGELIHDFLLTDESEIDHDINQLYNFELDTSVGSEWTSSYLWSPYIHLDTFIRPEAYGGGTISQGWVKTFSVNVKGGFGSSPRLDTSNQPQINCDPSGGEKGYEITRGFLPVFTLNPNLKVVSRNR